MPKRTRNQNTYLHGSWNALCDVCGFKFKAKDLKKRWDGLYVCKEDFETRHPSDFQKGKADMQSVAWTRPDDIDDTSSPEVVGNFLIDTITSDTLLDSESGSELIES